VLGLVAQEKFRARVFAGGAAMRSGHVIASLRGHPIAAKKFYTLLRDLDRKVW